ncbi:unnamed protein product, partial [Brassica oleracea]
ETPQLAKQALFFSSKRCDKPSDFVNLLKQALRPMGKTVYMIVDHLDLIKEWDKGAMILQFLFSLYSVLKLPQLGVILISGLPPDVYYSNMGYTDPLPVYFSEYSEEELNFVRSS